MHVFVKIAVSVLAVVAGVMFFLWNSMTWGERLLQPVQQGMSQSQVRAEVGAPLQIVTRSNATVAWYYDRWWSGDAVVYFGTNELVCAVEID